MIEQEYADIAAACDRLLRAADTSVGRLAIPLLHVVNEHPSHVAQYAPLLRLNSARPPSHIPHFIRTPVRIGRGLLRSLRAPPLDLQLEGRVDVLIVSRPVSPALANGDDDFYFGSMQRLLRERGATSTRVLVNQLPITPQVEAQIWGRCLKVRGQLRRIAHESPNTIGGAVAGLASRQALSASTAANLRLHAGILEVCRLLNPRIVVTTHEGDASERLIWQAARGNGRRPLCVGYQHTRLLERAHAIRRCLRTPGMDCDPDVILTLGEIPQAALAASPGLESVHLITYGSHRRAPSTPLAPFDARPHRCLVLPDGDERECAILFEFALTCARQTPDMQFVLRPHPVARRPSLRELPDNVSLSADRTLEQECSQARYCLYRGSSAAMHAVLAGVKPFYLARAHELPFDPLHDLSDWRETVSSPEDFAAGVQTANTSPDLDAARRAWSFCDRYVSRVRPEAIDELLRHSGRSISQFTTILW